MTRIRSRSPRRCEYLRSPHFGSRLPHFWLTFTSFAHVHLVVCPPVAQVKGLPAEKTSWLVVFPEGTRINAKTQKSSKAHMAKQGFPALEHLICPRFKGTQDILEEGRGTFKAVYDVTIGYKPISKFIFWRLPAEVHVHIDRLPIDSIPEKDGVKDWLLDRWVKKDQLLETFRTEGAFPGEAKALPGRLGQSLFTLGYCTVFVVLVTMGWGRLFRLIRRALFAKRTLGV